MEPFFFVPTMGLVEVIVAILILILMLMPIHFRDLKTGGLCAVCGYLGWEDCWITCSQYIWPSTLPSFESQLLMKTVVCPA